MKRREGQAMHSFTARVDVAEDVDLSTHDARQKFLNDMQDAFDEHWIARVKAVAITPLPEALPVTSVDLNEWNRLRDEVRGLMGRLTPQLRLMFIRETVGAGYCLDCGEAIRQYRCYCCNDD